MDKAISINALAEMMGMDRTTLTRNLGPLEKQGLVTRGTEGWRRSRALEVTKKGRSRLHQALPLWSGAQQALKKKLGNRNWHLVRDGLDYLIRAE
jgi:DNA-binding MarR family transcriptional regulator